MYFKNLPKNSYTDRFFLSIFQVPAILVLLVPEVSLTMILVDANDLAAGVSLTPIRFKSLLLMFHIKISEDTASMFRGSPHDLFVCLVSPHHYKKKK